MEEESTVRIKASVDHIVYQNDQNGYTVCTAQVGNEHITIVGYFPFLRSGDIGDFEGTYTVHPTYGQQFKAVSFERAAPESSADILKYLSSGAIRGIGPTTARRIVEKFGKESLDVIQNHPQDLATVRGVSLQKAYAISEEFAKQFGIQEIILLLTPYPISIERCAKIFRVLGGQSAELIRENPYILCRDEIGVSFEVAERMATDFEISPDNEQRLEAGVEYILRGNLANGHTCLPKNKLVEVAVRLLESDSLRVEQVCDHLIERLKIRAFRLDETDFLALPEYYQAEDYIAARLLNVKSRADGIVHIDDLEIDYIENKLNIQFEALQREASRKAFESGLLILTGGPGTGKTTTLNAIITLFTQRELTIELAAPTGRAAKRMTELTGYEAKTIHRLLEVTWDKEDHPSFYRNEKNPLECDVIILDEASMIDSLLFENLLKALRLSCRIILVGDVDQLPSVSAGNILGDLLDCGLFSSVALKKVFRQAGKSLIVTNAHAIIDHKPLDLSNHGKDFFFLHRNSAAEVCNTVLELCTERLPQAYGFDPLTDIQVLCPSRKTDAGTVNLNNLLQSCLNPLIGNKPSMNYKGIRISGGDKVMQIKNNYDITWERPKGETGSGVFNGDVGTVLAVDRRAGTLQAQFEDRVVTYYGDEVGELELAYSSTVHKSQGSEFDCVIIPLWDVPSQLRYRNLLYTGLTRAKKLLILVGSEAVLHAMAENDRKMLRYTMLKGFLDEVANQQ
ncbi:MAG: ATP-dependent RecD-like DNA helicase [Clostridia bacterium]|nr:ATP-dependent RecD-like DNA helicase [Clostridia bacterium]